ncbi:hypothetical protein [Cellulomonas xylanilytica]|uniref:GPR1/FUN34/yaaH family protein n=1 Tax=Cellulomonas xylanilytica TaxID=233583 RepID=A0A510V2A4_9CELL|nr:hypothetical protein [Cellulomonas xylanilytica]GEK21027.1 hypothetical protein CXY01_15470 [Cellulomonas xylanilytica]
MTADDSGTDRHLAISRIVVRPVGTPLPLGFLGLLVATTAFSSLQLGWIPPSEGHAVALGVLAFTVPLQLVSSVFGFLARDPVAGTGMGVLAGSWAAACLVTLTSPPGASSAGLGVLLVTAGVAMLVPAAAAVTKVAAAAVMGLSAVRFALTGVAQITAEPLWSTVAGVTGLVLAAVALYAALGFELEDARHRTLIPTGRRGAGSDTLSGTIEGELADVVHEAGVRKQL